MVIFVVFLGVNEIIARMAIPFGCRTAVYKKNRPARRSFFFVAHAKFGLGYQPRSVNCYARSILRDWLQESGRGNRSKPVVPKREVPVCERKVPLRDS